MKPNQRKAMKDKFDKMARGWTIEVERSQAKLLTKLNWRIFPHPKTMNARRFSTVFILGLASVRLGLRGGMGAVALALLMFVARTNTAAGAPVPNRSAIPLDQIGATVEKQYKGDGLSVCATPSGARLRCVFQRMEGEVTREGVWL